METKIIFNGKKYASPEAMPEEVRQAYQQAMAQFADADRNGIPDILERGTAGNVIAIQQSSISFNGREFKSVGEMPAVVRRLFEMAMGQADANRNGIPDALESALTGFQTPPPPTTPENAQPEFSATVNAPTPSPPREREPITAGLERTANALDIFLRILLSIVAIATVAGAAFLMLKMDGGSRSQGGRLYVAIAALVILGAVDSQFRKLVARRAPFSVGTSEAESRYGLISLLLLLLSAVVLFGAALLLP
ncbi:MAG TPA: hypothetical protein VGW77_32815 [Candidatus Binatia bacterium]|jgi:hypothetical protein|nr:hypothetical protein [Candidatus Binatia bacterium]